MKKTIILTGVMFAVFGLITQVRAEVLTMPDSSPASPSSEAAPAPSMPTEAPAAQSTSQTVPGRGMSMKDVESRFGEPQEKIPAVGNPPITRWVYNKFTVYFEYNLVIDSVLHHP